MTDDNLSLLQAGQQHAAKLALEQVEREKANQVAVEATSEGAVEASVSGTVTTADPALRWLRGTTVTAYVKQKWTGAKDRLWGLRATKRF